MLNSPGTIDSDYRGEIAQLVISKYCRAEFKITSSLTETIRGAGGFGHTGK